MEKLKSEKAKKKNPAGNFLPAMKKFIPPVAMGELASLVLQNPIPRFLGWIWGLWSGGKRLVTGKE